VGQRSVDEVGEGGFDDGVAAVGDVGVGGRLGGVGEKRVIPPDREQAVGGLVGVFDAAHDQSGGDGPGSGFGHGVGGFGDLGIRDPGPGFGIAHGAGIVDGGPGVFVDSVDGALHRRVAGQHQ
jgi:hypothetical protein